MGIFQTEDRADRAAAHYGAEGNLAARINTLTWERDHFKAVVEQLHQKLRSYESGALVRDDNYPHSIEIELFGGAPVTVSYEETFDGPGIGRLLINGHACDAEQVFGSVQVWDRANNALAAALDRGAL